MVESNRTSIFKLFNHAILIGILVVVLSFIINLVPCKTLINPEDNFNFCTLPPIFSNLENLDTTYYWLSNNPLTGLVLQFILPALIYISIYYFISRKFGARKKSPKILDLTKKR